MSEGAQAKAEEKAALERVQRRVGAIGFFAVSAHFVVGLIGYAHSIVDERRGDAILLLIMSIPFALLTYFVTRVILQRPLWNPWLFALALVPTVAGFIWVL